MRSRWRSRFTRTLLLTLLPLTCAVAATAETVVNSCGLVFTGKAVLAGDLDCSGFDGHAVSFVDGGRINLRGFTLTGGTDDVIRCSGNCEVRSNPAGGIITGSTGGLGILQSDVNHPANSLRIHDTVITGNATGGIWATNVTVKDSTVSQNGGHGVRASGNFGQGFVTVQRSVIEDNTGNGVDSIRTVRLVQAEVRNNGGHGVFGRPVRLKRSTVTGNGGSGVDSITHDDGKKTRISLATITANAFHGVNASEPCAGCRTQILKSTLTGNGTYSTCGTDVTCADVATGQPPRVKKTACNESYDNLSGFPGTDWDVCLLDP